MDRAVEDRAHQVVHRRIHDDKCFSAILLGIDDASEEHTRLGHDRAAWLEQEMAAERLDNRAHPPGIGPARGRFLVRIAHTEAAAEIQKLQRDSFAAQVQEKTCQAAQGAREGVQGQHLRADVRADAFPADVPGDAVRQVEAAGRGPVQAELVLVMACGDMRVVAGLHVGIHAHGNRRSIFPAARGARGLFQQHLQFGFGFHVEEQDAAPGVAARRRIAQGFAHLFAGLAHSGKDDALAGHSGAAQELDLTSGNGIEAAAQPRQQAQQGKIAVGLDRKTQRVR